jgi:hypothetical protein
MTLSEIRKAIARNLRLLADDNETVLEGQITKAGLDDEINRVYIEVIAQQLMAKSSQDFTVEARANTYATTCIVASVDMVNNYINSSTGVFGRAYVGSKIQNPDTNEMYTITEFINPYRVVVAETPQADLIGVNCYVLSNILVLNTDASDLKEVLKFEIKYFSGNQTYTEAGKQNPSNFRDWEDQRFDFNFAPVYTVDVVTVNDVTKRCIRYYPYPQDYKGEIRIMYTQLPSRLTNETDEPALNVAGVSEAIINGVTAWGFRILDNFAAAQTFEENNPNLGGEVPKRLTMILKNYRPERGASIRYSGFRRR